MINVSGSSLNYNVAGGTSAPQFLRQNTIWVNTSVDKESMSPVSTTQLELYIKAATGVVTAASSGTGYTDYFGCVAGRKYRFRLSDGATVLIASFTEVPAKGKTGTVIYGEGKEHGADDLDYTVTAPTGATHLAIYYYDSSANSSVPTLTVNDLTFEESLPESIAISSHIFSATQPNRVSKNKNLIVYPFLNTAAGSQGVIYTNNKDGTYTGNGTATANSFFAVTEDGDGSGAISLEPGTYTLSGCPAGGSLTTYKTMISIS